MGVVIRFFCWRKVKCRSILRANIVFNLDNEKKTFNNGICIKIHNPVAPDYFDRRDGIVM